MKRLQLGILVSTMLFCAESIAQQQGRVNGMVSEGATISLLKAMDSSVIKFAVAGSQGSFEIDKLAFGNYLISVSAAGFNTFFSEAFLLSETNPHKEFSTIRLSPAEKELSGVTVVAKKRMIEVKADRTIVNVEAGISNAGATAMEVLEKSPGITVDRDGNISMKGRSGVMVMIDGKPSYLSGTELANLLNNMSANQLDQIELMSNPPAKYDAAGNSGVINIITKKNKQRGWNGSLNISYGQGRYYKTNNSLNLNYRNEKFNVFANYSMNSNRGFNELLINRTYLDVDGKTPVAFYRQPTYLTIAGNNNTLKLGLDYYLNKNTTLGIVGTGFISPRKFDGSSTGYLQDGNHITDTIINTISDNKNRWINGTLNLNLRHQFNKSSELGADIDYVRYDMENNQLFTNKTTLPDNTIHSQGKLRGELPATISILSAKTDYSQHIGKDLKLEAGIKSSLVRTDNLANYSILEDNQWKPDYLKSNHFLYEENINAAYISANKSMGKFSLKGGLRFENTSYKGNQLGNPMKEDSSFKRNYNSLFPTLYITYNADSNNVFTLSTGKRIDRPAYQQLNPFLFFINEYTYQVGNPYIQPQFTWTYSVSHTYKEWLTTTLEHAETKQYFNQIFRTEGKVTILTEGNLARMQNTNLTISVQLNPAKWWSASINATGSHRKVNGTGTNSDFNSENINANASINNQFKFKKGWSAELSGNYNTPFEDAQFRISAFGQVTAGIGKQVLKGKGTLRLNMRDILFTQRINGDIRYQNVREHFNQSRETRVANISFTWRFGKQFSENRRRNNGGSSEEQQRVRQ